MKISDLMLDMATGDASAHDVAIQEAVGKVNVSSAIFEASTKIAELAGEGSLSNMIIQEAAEVGLPSDEEGATGTACEAVVQQLTAMLDVVSETAKKIKSATDKELKLIATVGKKFGVSASNKGNFSVAFATPFAKSILNDNGKKPIKLNDAKFIKAKQARNLAANYCKGLTMIAAAYGFSINDVFADPTISAAYGKHLAPGSAGSLAEVYDYLADGSKLAKCEKIISKDGHFTDTIKEDDIVSFVTSLYIVIAVSSSVADVIGKNADKKEAVAKIRAYCDEASASDDKKSKKKLDNTLVAIGEEATDYTSIITTLTDAIVKAFGDSTYALMEALNGGPSEDPAAE